MTCSSFVSTATLQFVNCSQIFLQVITLAEICNNTGTRITEWAWKGRKQEEKPGWPKQGNILQGHWEIWRQTLWVAFGDGKGTMEKGDTHRLQQPLGTWTLTTLGEWEILLDHNTLYNMYSMEQFSRTSGCHSRN
jgi:hypothetical protein